MLTNGDVLATDNDGKLKRWAPEGVLVDHFEADSPSKNSLPLVVSAESQPGRHSDATESACGASATRDRLPAGGSRLPRERARVGLPDGRGPR